MSDTFVVSATGKYSIVKDANAVLDYVFDWTEWLDAVVDAIATRDVVVTSSATPPSNIAVDSTQINGKMVVAWVSGGIAGEKAALRCRITTIGGRTDDRTVYLKVKER